MKHTRLFSLILFVAAALLLGACTRATEVVLPTATASPVPLPTDTPYPSRTPTTLPTGTRTLRPSSTPYPTGTQVPSLTPIPSKTPTPAVFGVNALDGPMWDDFSDPDSGWASGAADGYTYGYSGSAYNITVNIGYAEISAARTRTHQAVTVSADVTKLLGPDNAYFGVTCRKNDDSYYSFTINGAGVWAIYRTDGGKPTKVIDGTNKVIRIGNNATNHLRAQCKGSYLTFFVNGREVVTTLESRYQSGTWAGFVVGTTNQVGISVNFDNFSVIPGN